MGYPEQDLLTMTFEALLGANFLEDLGYTDGIEWGNTSASIVNSTVNSQGDVQVIGENATQANSNVNNTADTTATGVLGQSGKAASGMLVSNLARGTTEAFIRNTWDGVSSTVDMTARDINVIAKDNATLGSNVQIVTNSTTISDGGLGLLDEFIGKASYADYTDLSTNVTLNNGDRIRITDDSDDNYGDIMVYLGQDGTTPDGGVGITDLTTVDFSDLDYWAASPETQILPQVSFTDSDSMAVGIIIVRNDLTGGSTAFIDQSNFSASDDVLVQADQSTKMISKLDAQSSSEGGDVKDEGASDAANGGIVTNWLRGDAHAYITGSDADAADDLTVEAINSAELEATAHQLVETGDLGVNVLLAFNAVGWEPQNVIFTTIDTLIGSEEIASAFDANQRISAFAHIDGSDVDVGGDLKVSGVNNSTVTSVTGNDTISESVAVQESAGRSIGIIVANNRITTETRSYITDRTFNDYDNYDFDDIASTSLTLAQSFADTDVTGDTLIKSDDNATVNADIDLISTQIAVSDGGFSIFVKWQRVFSMGTVSVLSQVSKMWRSVKLCMAL